MRRREEEYIFVTKGVRVQMLRGDGNEFTPSVTPQASIAIAKAEVPDFAPIMQKNVMVQPYELKRSNDRNFQLPVMLSDCHN